MEMQQVVTAPPTPRLWSSIREAIRGSRQDFTTGNLNRAILLLAIPMILEMVLESLFAVVDVFWVSRLGADAVATVGLTESLLSLVFAIGLGLSLSTTAMVARRIGEKDPTGAAVAGVQAIVIGLAASAVIGIPCFFYGPDLLRLMGASPQVVAVGPRHVHRPQHRRPLSVLPPPPRHRAHPHPAQPDSSQFQRPSSPPARLAHRHPAIRHRPHELDRPRPHRQHLRLSGARRLYHRHSHTYLRVDAE